MCNKRNNFLVLSKMYYRTAVQILSPFILIVHLCVTNSREVYMRNVSALLGTDGIDLRCFYTSDPGDLVSGVDFFAKNESSDTFVGVVQVILLNNKLKILPYGEYLFGSVNITTVLSEVVLSFNDLKCKHERSYQCRLSIYSEAPIYSRPIDIFVQVPPSKPDNIVLLNSSPSITDGDNQTVACSGNVGRPPGIFIFQKYQRDHIVSLNYTATETSIQEISDNCSYYRTSNITLQVTADDNNAVIRCVVVSILTEGNMYVESVPLDVNYAVKIPTIITHPNKTDYLVGFDTSISLNCKTDGNPEPNYLWYKDNQIEAISTSKTLTITDVLTSNSGIYICIVNNTLNDVIHTKRVQLHVSIREEGNITPVMKQPNCENTAVVVVGTVCGSIILVLCLILLGVLQNKSKTLSCLLTRNHNDSSLYYVNTTQQQDPSLYEGVDHGLDVHNYEQLARRDHLNNNANLTND